MIPIPFPRPSAIRPLAINLALRVILLALAVTAVAFSASVASPPAEVQAAPAGCNDGTQPSGALYRICMPAEWNGMLVMFAHGFIAPQQPLHIPEEHLTLPDGTYLPKVATDLGFGFATTSYRKNGLAILEGVEDLKEVLRIFVQQQGQPRRVYLTGASEGGIVTALAVERHPDLFTGGGVAACGPVGDFAAQINYLGDVRVLFDYYFPGVIPGSAIDVPAEVVQNWTSVYEPRIKRWLLDRPWLMEQIYRVSRIPRQFQGEVVDAETIIELLQYNTVSGADAIATLRGQPFDNRWRWYFGSEDDVALNRGIKRYDASPAAVQEMKRYNTSGRLQVPLITIHTTGDPVVPFWHEILYKVKAPNFPHLDWPVLRTGHCNLTFWEGLGSFLLLRLFAP